VSDKWVAFLAKARAHVKILWALLAAGVSAIILLSLTRRRGDRPPRALESIEADKHQRVEAAKAEAALRIEAARVREGTLKGELAEVLKDTDGPRRRRNLIELGKQIDKLKRGE
jgi:hypothetical protein